MSYQPKKKDEGIKRELRRKKKGWDGWKKKENNEKETGALRKA